MPQVSTDRLGVLAVVGHFGTTHHHLNGSGGSETHHLADNIGRLKREPQSGNPGTDPLCRHAGGGPSVRQPSAKVIGKVTTQTFPEACQGRGRGG